MVKVRVNWGPLPEDCSVKLFEVYNTAHKSMYVLARDEAAAMSIAYTANHVYSPVQKIANDYSRLAHQVRGTLPGKLQKYGSLLQAAIERRLQGTVHLENEQLAIGEEIIA